LITPDNIKHLICLGGLPGSGKTFLATLLAIRGHLYAADDYFYNGEGEYRFDPEQLTAAHLHCQLRVNKACGEGAERVVVHNTFSHRWETEYYRTIAEEHGYNFFSVTLGDSSIPLEALAGRNSHGVPLHRLKEMAKGDAVTITAHSDTRPPWEREEPNWSDMSEAELLERLKRMEYYLDKVYKAHQYVPVSICRNSTPPLERREHSWETMSKHQLRQWLLDNTHYPDTWIKGYSTGRLRRVCKEVWADLDARPPRAGRK